MKTYIFIFLMFWFNNMFAPQPSKIELANVELSQIAKTEQLTEEEIQSDSTDVKVLTHYKMKSTFSKEDRKKVRKIAKNLGIKTKWLYKIFYIECRGNIKATNPNTYATGLIGFLPQTAIKLGTTTEQLQQMTVSEQLDYVEKYFRLVTKGKKLRKPADVYLAIFSPANLGQHDTTLVGRKCKKHQSKVYKYNKALDMNNDSVITIRDINTFVSLL